MAFNLGRFSLVLAAAVLLNVVASPVEAKDETYNDWRGLAIRGYDPVAYHTEGKPVEGSKKHEFKWKYAKWRFASEENRITFEADPDKYAPRYGGYCAWAVAEGYTASVDPQNAWRIVDGKLYLNYSAEVQKQWEEDIPSNIKRANANWPGVLE